MIEPTNRTLITNPKNIICIGLNYADHIEETSLATHDLARALQFRGSQWILGKSLDNFAPIGPTIVPPDDFDFENATITTTVNGEVRQQAKLEQMLFKPDAIIEFVSQYITLQEGDIIFTGTPSGVVLGKNEKRYGWLKSVALVP